MRIWPISAEFEETSAKIYEFVLFAPFFILQNHFSQNFRLNIENTQKSKNSITSNKIKSKKLKKIENITKNSIKLFYSFTFLPNVRKAIDRLRPVAQPDREAEPLRHAFGFAGGIAFGERDGV